MQTTSNYGFRKPEGTDTVNIDDINYNADQIDAALTPTADLAQVPIGNGPGKLVQWVSWIANRIKAITGKTNWWEAPDVNLATLAVHKSRHAIGGIDQLTPMDIGATSGADFTAHLADTANAHGGKVSKAGDTMTDGDLVFQAIGDRGIYFKDADGTGKGWFARIRSAGPYIGINNIAAAKILRIMDTGELLYNSDQVWHNDNFPVESGTFTPSVVGGITGGTQTYTTRKAYYRRQGNMVHCDITIALSTKDAATAGQISIVGLPFVTKNQDNRWVVVAVGDCSYVDFATNYYALKALMPPGAAQIALYQTGDSIVIDVLESASIGANFAVSFSVDYEIAV